MNLFVICDNTEGMERAEDKNNYFSDEEGNAKDFTKEVELKVSIAEDSKTNFHNVTFSSGRLIVKDLRCGNIYAQYPNTEHPVPLLTNDSKVFMSVNIRPGAWKYESAVMKWSDDSQSFHLSPIAADGPQGDEVCTSISYDSAIIISVHLMTESSKRASFLGYVIFTVAEIVAEPDSIGNVCVARRSFLTDGTTDDVNSKDESDTIMTITGDIQVSFEIQHS